MKKIFALAFTVLLISACEKGEKSEPIRTGAYFDLVELLDEQTAIMGEEKPKLSKQLEVDGETETITTTLDSAKMWKDELELFYQADINRLGLENAYTSTSESLENGQTKKVDKAKWKDIMIRSIEYYYEQERLSNIKITVEEKNTIYKFNKELNLEFSNVNGQNLLTYFSIYGDQKMVLKSPLNYNLRANIDWNL